MLVNDLYYSFREICPQSIISKDHFSALNSSRSPSNQTKSDINVLCRTKLRLTGKITVPIRTQVAIAQILIAAQRKQFRPLSIEIIQHKFFLSEDLFDKAANRLLVEQNKRFPCFVYYMQEALLVLNPTSQMDFICQVVTQLSRETKKFVTGGGTESICTAMRYRVFEVLTGKFRPKTVQAAVEGRDHRVRQAGLLLPIPLQLIPAELVELYHRASISDSDVSDAGFDYYYYAEYHNAEEALLDFVADLAPILSDADAEADAEAEADAYSDSKEEDDDPKAWLKPVQENLHPFAPISSDSIHALSLVFNSVENPALFSHSTNVWASLDSRPVGPAEHLDAFYYNTEDTLSAHQ